MEDRTGDDAETAVRTAPAGAGGHLESLEVSVPVVGRVWSADLGFVTASSGFDEQLF